MSPELRKAKVNLQPEHWIYVDAEWRPHDGTHKLVAMDKQDDPIVEVNGKPRRIPLCFVDGISTDSNPEQFPKGRIV